MVDAVIERLTVVPRVVGLIPARNKYLHGIHVVVPGTAVYVCECKYL